MTQELAELEIDTARVFRPLLEPARYKGAWGGRGSGKSHFFAELMVEEHLAVRGFRSVCIREVQKTLKDSAKRLIEDKIRALGVSSHFRILDDRIVTPGGGLIIFQGMQDHNAETIKSLEGFDRAWIEEAQTLSETSLMLLRPTIRKPGSEIWASWNPRRKKDAIDVFLRQLRPESAIVVKANWQDNPWFPEELALEKATDERLYPDRVDHIWDGGYVKVFEGAYYAKQLNAARNEGRIRRVVADPILRKRAIWDLGGAGKNADAMAIWIMQFGKYDIPVLDYIEGQSQVLSYYVAELRKRGHSDALCILPHDGVNTNNVTGKRIEDHLREAEFEVEVIPNQGPGAAMMRIEAARRLFPRVAFDEAATEAGREALGAYHPIKDDARGIDKGPDHDWASHGADAYGLAMVAYEQPKRARQDDEPARTIWTQQGEEQGAAWLGN